MSTGGDIRLILQYSAEINWVIGLSIVFGLALIFMLLTYQNMFTFLVFLMIFDRYGLFEFSDIFFIITS